MLSNSPHVRKDRAMNIYEVLKRDHREIADMLTKLKFDDGSSDRSELFEHLKEALDEHTESEEQLFYTVIEGQEDTEDVIEMAREEHEGAAQLISEMESLDLGSDAWQERLQDLERAVLAHVEMEETEIFDLARVYLDEQEAERLGKEVNKAEPVMNRDLGPQQSSSQPTV